MKVAQFLLGVANGTVPKNSLVLYFAKGLITALELLMKGDLTATFDPETTPISRTDWFNLVKPSIPPLPIIVMDTTKMWLSMVRGDNSRESSEFLLSTKFGDMCHILTKEPYPFDGREKAQLIMALWKTQFTETHTEHT